MALVTLQRSPTPSAASSASTANSSAGEVSREVGAGSLCPPAGGWVESVSVVSTQTPPAHLTFITQAAVCARACVRSRVCVCVLVNLMEG